MGLMGYRMGHDWLWGWGMMELKSRINSCGYLLSEFDKTKRADIYEVGDGARIGSIGYGVAWRRR